MAQLLFQIGSGDITNPPDSPVKGGGQVGTPSGGTGGGLVADTGGVNATNLYFFIPLYNFSQPVGNFYIFDTANFNDPTTTTSYTFRAEDIVANRVPTVRRVLLQYRDLGLVTITVKLEATNDLAQVVTNSVSVQLGNLVPTNKLFTNLVDISLTGYRPQLTISRAAGAGPLVLTQVTMTGEVEDQSL